MQYKFKYNGSTEGRKLSQNQYHNSHKNQTLPYINLLDKCTQILREDRIWIRNQIKCGDPEVISIFKEVKKPINMQHLQIRLRKFVNTVKNKAKMEQLMKFKQNMNLGQWKASRDQNQDKFNKSINSKQIPSNPSNRSLQNCTRLNQSTQGRSYKGRNNNSIEKPQKPMIYPYRNSSVNHSNSRRALQNYPAPMEQISERDSQNMTSARNRIMASEDQNEGMNFGFTNSYSQWKRPENKANPLDNLRKQINQSTKSYQKSFHDDQRHYEQNNYQKSSPERDIYEHYNKKSFKKDERPSFQETINQQIGHKSYNNAHYGNNDSQEDQSQQHQQQSEPNFMYEHEYERQHNNFILDSTQDNKQNYRHQAPQIMTQNLGYTHNFQQQFGKEDLSATHNFTNTQNLSHTQNFNNTQNLTTNYNFNNNQFTSQTKNTSKNPTDDTLFTSPQLLQQCRNFIKNKSSAKNTIQKKQLNIPQKLDQNKFDNKYVPLSFQNNSAQRNNLHQGQSIKPGFHQEHYEQLPYSYSHHHQNPLEDTMSRPFSNINCGFVDSVKISEPISHQKQHYQPQYTHKIHEEPISFPKKHEAQHEQQIEQDAAKNYEYFQTFANQSSQKKTPFISSKTINTAEQLVDMLLESVTSENQGYVQWRKLVNLVEKYCPTFIQTFVQYLQPQQGEHHVLISNAGRVMEDLLQREQESQNQIRNIYKLLDIEHKCYINQQDIQDFLSQLQQAQAEDIETIAQYLWKLFQSIDEDSQESQQKRIDYWGIYARKNNKNFRQLNQILRQFQFQIQ